MLNALDHKVFHSHFQIILLKDDKFRINRNNIGLAELHFILGINFDREQNTQ